MPIRALTVFTALLFTTLPASVYSQGRKATATTGKQSEVLASASTAAATPDGTNENTQPQSILEPMLSPDLFTGTLNMQVPLDLPAGRGGVQPNLRLQYQNGNANGPLGIGWRLEPGAIQVNPLFGALQNCNEQNPINSCYLISFQGGRYPLVFQNGLYAAKQEGRFFRIRKLSAADAKDMWEVTDKKGTKFLFGEQDSSRQSGQVRIFKWFLDRVEDTNGNYMVLSYQSDGKDTYLSEIRYTGNRNVDPNISVKLAYEPRSDVYNHYEFGTLISTVQRLKTISAESEGTPIKRYELNYLTSGVTYRSVLFKVLEYGTDLTTTTPAIVFQSKQFENGWFDPYQTWHSGPSPGGIVRSQCFQGDFNGDGRLDLACYTQKNGLWHVAFSTSGGWSAPNWWYGPAPPGDVSVSCLAADFNGDSKTDIACYDGGGKWSLALSGASGWQSVRRDKGPSPVGSVQDRCLAGNFVAPAVAAIACWTSGDTWEVATLSAGTSWNTVSWSKGPIPNAPVWQKCRSLDLIGDDRSEIACTDGSGIWAVAQGGTAEWSTTPWQGPVSDIPLRYSFVGDFNGDGLQDVISYHNGHWVVGLSTGSGFDVQDWGTDPTIAYSYCVQGDFNGDGKTDVACYSLRSNTWRVALSTGASLVAGTWPGGAGFIGSSCFAGDAIGSGKTDLICFTGGGDWTITTPKFEIPDAVATVIHPLGGISDLEYQYSTLTADNHIPFNINVISTVSNRARMSDPTYQRQFVYEHGVFVRRSREFRGFGHVKVIEPADTDAGVQKDYWFHQGTAFGLPSAAEGLIGNLKTLLVSDSSGTALRKVDVAYSLNSDIPPYFDPPQEVDTYTYGDLTPVKTVAKYSYDPFGNITEEDKLGSRPEEIEVTTRTYLTDLPNWIVGLPTNESKFSDLAKQHRVKSTDLYYDESPGLRCAIPSDHRGNLTRVVRWSSTQSVPNQEARFGYDAFGNIVCESDARGKINKITYDPRFATFPVSFQNPIGQSVYISYSRVNAPTTETAPYGSIVKMTDLNSNATDFKYDPLGRLTKLSAPDTSETTILYDFTPTHNVIKTTLPASMTTMLYLDGFGRVVQEEMSGPGNTIIERDRKYNRSGEIGAASFPYFKLSANPQWNTIRRDALGRVASMRHPDASQELFCYRGTAEAVVDQNGHWKLYRSDWNGNVTDGDAFVTVRKQCSDEMFTGVDSSYSHVTYSYDTLGQLTRILDPARNETTFTWDSLGNLTEIRDPDRGLRTLAYDSAGNLMQFTDARGSEVAWTYDDLGRPLTKSVGEKNKHKKLIAKLEYDLKPGGIGNLTRVKERSGTTEYSYDKENRPTEIRQKVHGLRMVWRKNYDGLGRLTSFTYPGGTQVEYTYDGPFEDSIRVNKSVLMKTSLFTALGQPIDIQSRNGVLSHYSYYDGSLGGCRSVSFRLCAVGISKDHLPLRMLQYQYDPKGNVVGVKADSESDTLDYDALDRLTAVTSNVPSSNETFSFNVLGNIASKSDIGTYSYGASPHAVTRAGTFTYSYDTNGNETTGAGRRLSYDNEGRLNKVLSPHSSSQTLGFLFPRFEKLTFEYDWAGSRNRIVKRRMLPYPLVWLVPGRKTVTIGNLYRCQHHKCSTYIHRGKALVAQTDQKQALSFIYGDLLRSTRLVADPTTNATIAPDYSSYGSLRKAIPAKKGEIGYLFTAQELDETTGLYYFGARYYDPKLGRFVSPDPLFGHIDDLQALNGYSYVRNNPQSLTDPTGMQDDGTDDNEPGAPEAPSPDNPGQQEDQNLPTPVGSISTSFGEMEQTAYDSVGRSGFERDQNTNFIGQGPAPSAAKAGPYSGPLMPDVSVNAAIDLGSLRASFSILGQLYYVAPTGFIYYPPHITFMMAEQDTEWTLAGAGVSVDVGTAQGDVKQGAPGPSQAVVVGGWKKSVGTSFNTYSSDSTISKWSIGKEIGVLKGPSYTVSLLGEPFSSRDLQDAISRLLLSTATFGWGARHEGNTGRIHTDPW